MPSNKAIKRRLVSVKSTQKITRAMNMVAASRLQKNKEYLTAARSFFIEAENIINTLKNREDTAGNIFWKPQEINSAAYLVITSDQGLCGGYNTNITEKALLHMNRGKNEKIIALGLKGYEYFKKHGKNILSRYDDVLEVAFYEEAERIGDLLLKLYTTGEVDEVYIAYTKFESVLTHIPCVEKVLPIENNSKALDHLSDMQFEPDTSFFLEKAIRMYLNTFVFTALLESFACEQAARMLSMNTAVNNASDILEKLTHSYNRSRQAAITQEISEVVSNTNISNQRG